MNKNLAAPELGTDEEGALSFQTVNGDAPYIRGGGTPITRALKESCLTHFNKHTGNSAAEITIGANGQAMNHMLFRSVWGGNMVSSNLLFGTTKKDLGHTFERIGRNQITWVDPCDTDAFIKNTNKNTNVWFMESISNPAGRVPDFKRLKEAAEELNVILAVDATLCVGMPKFNGLEYADVLSVSMTKQSGGGDNINTGGAIITSNDFPWAKRVDTMSELSHYFPNELPHNPLNSLMSNIGLHEGQTSIAVRDAESIIETLPTLQSRTERMCENARDLAQLLEQHKAIKSVSLAGYNTDDANDNRMHQYFNDNHFVMLIDFEKGHEAAAKFVDAKSVFHGVALGQKTTAISRPAASTHRGYSSAQQESMGIYPGTIRASVGTEDFDKIAQTWTQALDM